MKNARAIRVAGVGAGYFSQFHYDAWRRIEGAELVSVADHQLAAAQATGARAFADTRQMLDDMRPDLLDIVLPPPAHAEVISLALEHQVPTIICQKPFCLTLDEAQEMTARAEAAGSTLVVHENFRFMPWYRAIKQALEGRAIGTLLQATFRLRPGDGQGPEAYLDRQPYFQSMPRFLVHETAVHWVDTFSYLMGAPEAIYADLRRINPVIAGEDAGYILFDHPNGVRAVFDGNRHLDHASDNLRRTMGEAMFEGSEGTLSLFGDGRVEVRRFGEFQTETLLAADTWDGFGGDCVRALQAHVVDYLRGLCDLENTARAYCEIIRIKDAIYASAKSGAKVQL